MKKILALFFPFFIFSIHTAAQTNIDRSINKLLEDSLFNTAVAAVNVYDLNTQSSLFQKNTTLLLRPASNMKVLTTVAGLLFLGPDYCFKTSLYHTGKINHSVLKGDLYICGGGDPDFTTSDLDTLIQQLKQFGIKEIRGNIIADLSFTDSLFWGKGWMWDDDPSTDAPYLSALNINKNSFIIIAEPGKVNSKAKIKTIPKSNFFKIKNYSLTVAKKDTIELEFQRDWIKRSNNITVSGHIPSVSSHQTSEMNVYNPALYFLTLFKEKLHENKIRFKGRIKFSLLPALAREIYSMNRPFVNVIMGLNKNSDNLSAEMTLKAMAVKFFGKPARAENGIKMIDSLITLSGLDYRNYRIVDGSGVSHYNLLNADLLLSVLKFIYNNRPDLFNILYNSFPVAGVDGTLRERMKDSPAFSNVHAKTGTISGVSCLSGYVTAKNKHLLAFSIMIQNYLGSSSRATKIQNEICRVLAEYE